MRTHMASTNKKIHINDSTCLLEDWERNDKPPGLWYQIDGDWERWCENENFECGKFKHDVIFKDENILIIKNEEEILKFNEKYGIVSDNYGWVSRSYAIDWKKVCKEYDALEISPYLYDYRLNLYWYYSWDCASGVIWRPRGVELNFTENK